jgi:single-strand DNA-binding protein
MEKIFLIGRAGKDAELRYGPTGTPVTKINLAVNRRSKDKSGEKKDEAVWYSVTLFGNIAETMANLVHKGTQLYIEGRLEAKIYTPQEGNPRLSLEVIASDIQLLGNGNQPSQSISSSSDDSSSDDFPF